MSELRKFTVDFLRVLADPTRLDILYLLENGEKSSSEIQKEFKKSQSTVSKHLSILADNNLIDFEKKNNIKYYNLNRNTDIFNLIGHINSVVTNINKEKLKDIRDVDIHNTLS